MEAAGIYWRPVWQVLAAEGRRPILANAAHVKNVPGRKTDVADAVWLSDLPARGPSRPSFVARTCASTSSAARPPIRWRRSSSGSPGRGSPRACG